MNQMEMSLRMRAKQKARDYLENETQYQLGFIEAEQHHPLTKGLGETAQRDIAGAVQMILSVDEALIPRIQETLSSDCFRAFSDAVSRTLLQGGRIFLSGCGATGRLCLNLEACWRRGWNARPDCRGKEAISEQVIAIMTGGDYALVKSVESFEDLAVLGAAQIQAYHPSPTDLLIGVTATAETTSVLGTAFAAAKAGCPVWMVVCSRPEWVSKRLDRAREVFSHLLVRSLYLPCGPMAVTGSTRMQSSTYEQITIAAALEAAGQAILSEKGLTAPTNPDMASGFASIVRQLRTPGTTAALADYISLEAKVYRKKGFITYFADEFLLDVLSDTTERSPTFMVPPFAPMDEESETPSWAFVKNPACETKEAWNRCFGRPPRCIQWTKEDYLRLGADVNPVPAISEKDLLRFTIGWERDLRREGDPCSVAVWVDAETETELFRQAAEGYPAHSRLVLRELGLTFEPGLTNALPHIAMKMVMNTVSTVTMGNLGRLKSNCMIWMDMSNKKLVDRSARLIVQECGISYEKAMEELFYTQLALKAEGRNDSPAGVTIRRLWQEGCL